MKLNHFICPNCGHDFFEEAAYATCDACGTFFYLTQSRTCKLPAPHYQPPVIVPTVWPYEWPQYVPPSYEVEWTSAGPGDAITHINGFGN